MNKGWSALFGVLLLTAASPASAQAVQTQPQQGQIQQVANVPTANVPSSKIERLVAPLNGAASLMVSEPHMIDMRNATDCKLDSKLLRQRLLAALTAERLPVAGDNAVPRPDLVRLILKPEVATLKDGVVNCVSWVSLSAQTQEVLRLPPSTDRKPVTVTNWTRGALIMTPIIDHATGVADVYERLARVLARQWRVDNPELANPSTAGPAAEDAAVAPARNATTISR